MTPTKPPAFTLKHDLPDHLGIPRKPDGSLPQVVVSVDAENMDIAVSAVHALHANVMDFSVGWMRTLLTADELAELAATEGEDIPESALAAGARVHDPFLTYTHTADIDELLEDGVVRHKAVITVTAPSLILGIRSILEMMEPERVNLMLREVRN